EQLQPLLVTIEERQATEAVKSLNMGGVSFSNISGSITVGDIDASIHAGGDVVGGDKVIQTAQAGDGGIAVIGDGNVIHAGKPYTPPLIRPPRAKHFTDREQELKDLLADLQPGRVVTLCGPGGMGKTALATEAIYHLAPGETLPDRFPDGVYFYSFYNQPQAAVALEDMALAFGEEAKPTPQAAARRALANRRALLLLDGAEDADNLPAVLQAAPTCGVIITTRRHSDAPADFTDLSPLPPAEAVTLLRNWAGDRHAVDEVTAQDICDLVGHLPLAVRLAGRYLARSGDSPTDYLDWLRATPLEALDQGRRRHDSVDVLLTKSLDQVSDTAQQVLAVTGLLALASFDRAMMAAALASEVNALRRPLNELVNFGLLLRQKERYIISHALILTYARPLPQPAAALPRLLVYFTALARQHHEQGRAGHERLDVERRHMVELLDRCPAEQAEVAFGLLRAVDGYFMYRGYNAERRLAWKMGLRLAEDAADNQEQANCIQALGDVHRMLAEYELARQRYEAARPIYEAIGARLGEANCIQALG
ncbi:MAG: hypothetical protein KDJ97_16645, partial [Anaerolineae bacterium]|nr:hypothetical protein [Anaerolineae bacterium]